MKQRYEQPEWKIKMDIVNIITDSLEYSDAYSGDDYDEIIT